MGSSHSPSQASLPRIPVVLRILIAFDWGEGVDLELASRLLPAEFRTFPRNPRSPGPLQYQPPPLRFQLAPVCLQLPVLGTTSADLHATLFDFAAVQAELRIPCELDGPTLTRLAGGLWDASTFVAAARTALQPLFDTLQPSLQRASWSELSEEYVEFQFSGHPGYRDPAAWLAAESGWFAGLLRLEAVALSDSEIAEATRLRMSYTPQDLILVDWAAAVVVGDDSEEVQDTIAFANLQLLELRQIDTRLDQQLDAAYPTFHRLSRGSHLPFWKTHMRSVRALGTLKVDANEMLERSRNVLKLIGDQYLARLFQMLATRFRLDEWGGNIRQSINVLESLYEVLAEQSATYRAELLEVLIVALIVIELVTAWWASG
jgi:hypothetical protein